MHFLARNTTDGYRPSVHHLTPYSSEKGHKRTNSGDSRNSFFKFKLGGSQNLVPSEPHESTDEDTDFDEPPDLTQEFVNDTELSKEHDCKKEGCQRIVINVSGMRFETQLRTLNRLPNTLLGDKQRREKYWDPKKKELFFDRHRPSFTAILYFYQSGGRLERPIEVPSDIFLSELQFFELGKTVINAYKQKEGYIIEAEAPIMPKGNKQKRIWEFLEYPESSFGAKIFAAISVIFILVSVASFCIETLPVFDGTTCINVTLHNDNGTVFQKLYPNFGHPLFIIESVCIAWFVLEIAVRFTFCPSKLEFIKNLINWIDIAAIAPYFIFFAIFLVRRTCNEAEKGGALSVLRILRVVRILKLSKHSEGLKILGKTLQTSVRELMMFVLFLGIGVVIFAGAIYYAELQQTHSYFTSIPDSFWWAVVSMTTVGYGDVYPKGVWGKIIGSVTVLSGLLAIALPVPVIVTNFNTFYRAAAGRSKGGS